MSDYDLSSQMDDRLDGVFCQHSRDQCPITNVSYNQGCLGMNRFAQSCRKIIDHHDLLARIYERLYKVAAHVAGTARY